MLFLFTETHYEKCLRKVSNFIAMQNEQIYNPKGLNITDPVLRYWNLKKKTFFIIVTLFNFQGAPCHWNFDRSTWNPWNLTRRIFHVKFMFNVGRSPGNNRRIPKENLSLKCLERFFKVIPELFEVLYFIKYNNFIKSPWKNSIVFFDKNFFANFWFNGNLRWIRKSRWKHLSTHAENPIIYVL